MEVLLVVVILFSFLIVLIQKILTSLSSDYSVALKTAISPSAEPISIKIAGDKQPIPVWSSTDSWKKCHLIDVPDTPARAFVGRNTTTIQLVCGAIGYHDMHGLSVFNQTRSCKVAWNATLDPDPSMFAGNEFLDSPFRFDNGTVIALIHTEYPGDVYHSCNALQDKEEDQHGHQNHRMENRHQQEMHNLQQKLTYPTCWTVTIGLGISYDWGQTWQHVAQPPHHLVAAVPYRYNQSYLAYGWGDPSNIVYNSQDGYYYVTMYNRNQVGVQPPGVCVARTRDLMDPKSWRAWNGSSYSTSFIDPYRDNPKIMVDHICETITFHPAEKYSKEKCNIFGLVWSVYLNQFVATIGCSGPQSHAFHFAISRDLIHWSNVQEFYSQSNLPPDVAAMTTSFNYPTFMDMNAYSRHNDANFYTIGKQAHLFWTSLGHSPYTDGRHLWATAVEFVKGKGYQG
jgi:hypothetical protein